MLKRLKNRLNYWLNKEKIDNSYIDIFESKYGLDGGDLSVWAEKTAIETLPYKYHLSVEGFIYYKTLEGGVEYYNELLLEFENFIVNNFEVKDEDIENAEYIKWGKYKRLYGVDINHTKNGWTIDVEPPSFYSLNDTYLWFKGFVNQLNDILNEYKKINS